MIVDTPIASQVPQDPLTDIDDVDWASLKDAYGPATGFPDLARQLQSYIKESRSAALHTLYGTIFHQGSRYNSSSRALPFLINLAAHPLTPDRAEVLALVGSLAVGYENQFLPSGVPATKLRQQWAKLEEEGFDGWKKRNEEKWEEYVNEAADDRQRRSREREKKFFSNTTQAQYDEEVAIRDCYEAAKKGMDVYLRLLVNTEEGESVILQAIKLVGWFPEESRRILPQLQHLVTNETNETIRITSIIAIGLLQDTNAIPFLHNLYDKHSASLVRWATATALILLGKINDGIMTTVIDAIVSTEINSTTPFPYNTTIKSFAIATLGDLTQSQPLPTSAHTAMLDMLDVADISEVCDILNVICRTVLHEPLSDPLPAFESLQAEQQRLFGILLAKSRILWQWVNFLEIMKIWGVKLSRRDLLQWMEIDDPLPRDDII